jgi:hypothetical protein
MAKRLEALHLRQNSRTRLAANEPQVSIHTAALCGYQASPHCSALCSTRTPGQTCLNPSASRSDCTPSRMASQALIRFIPCPENRCASSPSGSGLSACFVP